jgi:AraC-like DNA-binding protein
MLPASTHPPRLICAAVGATERTIRYACIDHLGMGPIRYLLLRRMHFVRRALSRADNSTATVTRIATDHGLLGVGTIRSCLSRIVRRAAIDHLTATAGMPG